MLNRGRSGNKHYLLNGKIWTVGIGHWLVDAVYCGKCGKLGVYQPTVMVGIGWFLTYYFWENLGCRINHHDHDSQGLRQIVVKAPAIHNLYCSFST
jgi:hypothetical protein